MKKSLLLFPVLFFLILTAKAQTQGAVQKLSIGAEIALPTSLGTKDLLLAGGSLQYEYPVGKSVSVTGSGGYISLFSTDKNVPGNVGFIPVKAGIKYYFGNSFYAATELGATIGTDEGVGTGLAFSAGLGTSLAVSPKSNVDLGVRFETWPQHGSFSNLSFVGFRAAYAFGL